MKIVQQLLLRSLFASLLFSLLSLENAFGFSYVMMRDADLLAQSHVVVVGRVQDIVEIADSSGVLIASRYRIAVERDIKGEPAALIEVEIPGVRELGEGRMWLPSAPHFFIDDRALWFLEQIEGDLYQPMQYALGVFNLRKWQDKDYAVRPLRGASVVPREGPNYVEPSNVRQLNKFVDYLQAQPTGFVSKLRKEMQLNVDSVAADYFVTDVLRRAEIAGDLVKPSTFLSSGGQIFRWPDFDSSGTVQWSNNGGGSYIAEISQALSAWTNASGSNISLNYAGTTTANLGLTGSDGVNAILFEDPNNEIGGSYSCASGGTIGIGGPRAVGTHVFDGTTYWSNTEGDVVFQDGASCLLDKFSGANAAEVITHEVGHTLGLGHSCGDGNSGSCDGNPTGDDEAIMRATAHTDGRGASLGVDDIAAMASLYPADNDGGGDNNEAPTISPISNQETTEGATTAAIAFTVDDPDGDENNLVISGSSSNTNLVPNANIVFGGGGANRAVAVTPAASGTGVAIITITVDDGSDTAIESFLVTVNTLVVNVPPTISSINNQTIERNTATDELPFVIDDPDGDVGALVLTVASSNNDLLPLSRVVLSGSGANRTVQATPLTSGTGGVTLTITASDGQDTATSSFLITVNAPVVNLPPTISSIDNQTIDQNTSTAELAFSIADPNGNVSALAVTVSSSNPTIQPESGIVLGGSGAIRTVTLTPAADQTGSALITITVSDGEESDSELFLLKIVAVESDLPPTISNISDQTIEENTSTEPLPFSVSDSDGVGASLVVTASSSNQALVSDSHILLDGAGVDRTVLITPNADVSGSTTITLTVDDSSDSAATSFVLTVNAAVDSLLVRNLSDSGSGSIREVIGNASDGDTILFDPELFQTDANVFNNPLVQLMSAIVIDKNLHINGDVNGDGIGDGGITSEQGIFEILTPVVLQLSGLYLHEATATQGGAVLIDSGGEAVIANSFMSENVAQFGGAIAVVDGTLTIVDSEFQNNSAVDGGAVGIADIAGTVDIQRSTFIGNGASAEGGAIVNFGADTRFTNLTLYDNSASFGGGLFNGAGGLLTANNITVFNNSSGVASGSDIGMSGGELVLTNSLVAQRQSGDISLVVNGGNLIVSYSLIESMSGEFQNLGGNLIDVAPEMNEPAEPVNYGGFTRTLSPSSLSPVLDAADPNVPGSGGTCATEDQAGNTRPLDANFDGLAICDIGSFEFSLVSGASPSSESIDIVQEQYIAFYGRAGDPVGVQFWGTRLDQLNGVLSGIQNQFGNSQEFIDLIVPDGSSSVDDLSLQQKADLINSLYENMFARSVEGQADDPETGLGFWISELDRPEVSLIDISTRVADGAQAQDRIVLDSRVVLARRITDEFVAQEKPYTEQHIEPIRDFLFEQIGDEDDDPLAVDVGSFVADLAD